tara:strand:- start:2234 stop:2959 length:726 start_codon:yes stop_codon:yes gene_type:complete
MITKQVRIYALLTAYSWPKRRPEYTGFRSKYLLRTVRKVNLKSKLLKDYKLLDKHSNTFMCVFHNEKNNEIVYTIRGTDLTRFEENDVFMDFQVLRGTEKLNKRFKNCYDKLFEILKEYPKCKFTICGGSLGGRIAINLLDSDLGNKVTQVHVFNCATSLTHLYKSAKCISNESSNENNYCKNRMNKLHIHLVNNDPISILSMGEISKTKTVYPKKSETSQRYLKGKNKKIKMAHSILNFI